MAKKAAPKDKARAPATPTGAEIRNNPNQHVANVPTNAPVGVAASVAALQPENASILEPSLLDDDIDANDLMLEPLPIPSDHAGSNQPHMDLAVNVTSVPSAAAASPAAQAAMHAARLVAMQQAEYQRSVELVRQQLAQRHMQQMQQTTQAHLQLQQQQQQQQQQQLYQSQPSPSVSVGVNPVSSGTASSSISTSTGGGNVMHHIQQRLQERIQNKQHLQLYDQMRQQAAAAVSADSSAIHQQQQQQLQMQQYHAMIRELEMHATSHAMASAAGQSAASAAAPLSQEEQERLRQERLQRLHQIQLQKLQQQQQQHKQMQAQHAAALRVTLTGMPTTLTPEQLQLQAQLQQHQNQRAHIDHDRLRLLQQQQMQQPPPATATVTTKTEASQTPQPLAKPPVAKAAPKKRAPSAADGIVKADPASGEGSSASTDAPLKKKRKSPAESQMETLVRVLCRLHLSKNENEFRTQLEKLGTWIGKSVDLCLLRFALRDLADILTVKQKQFEKSAVWATELLPKYTFTHDKLRHSISTLEQKSSATSQANPAAAAASGTAGSLPSTAAASSGDSVTLGAREHAYAALKEQMLMTMQMPKLRAPKPMAPPTPSGGSGGVAAGAGAVMDEAAADAKAAKKKKKELSIDVNASSTIAAKTTDTTVTTATVSTVAQAKPTASRPPIARPVQAAAPVSTVISPRVAQQLFDLDLGTRSCAMAADEGEERFYFPLKPVTNIMRRALPGGGTPSVRRRRKRRTTKEGEDAGAEEADVKGSHQDEEEDDEDGEGDDGDEAKGDNEDADDEDDAKGEAETQLTSGTQATADAGSMGLPSVKIDDDAAAFMQECVTEFLLFFTSEARDQSMLEKKKGSITGTNLVQAMENLGFSPYAKVLANFNDKVRKVQDDHAQQKLERKKQNKQRKLEQELLVKREQEEAARKALGEATVAIAATTSTGMPPASAVADDAATASVPPVPSVDPAIATAPVTLTS